MPIEITFSFTAPQVKEQLDHQYQSLLQSFPDTVDEARDTIAKYLQFYDPARLRIFQGQSSADFRVLDQLNYAWFFISSMLKQERKANSRVTHLQKDVWCRRFLKLPLKGIDGGKKD